MKAARPRRCCGVSWLPVSASESILSSGSKILSPASPIIPLPGLPTFCRKTGRPPRLDIPKLLTERDTLRRSLVLVILGRLRILIMDMNSDVDRAKRFYEKLGFRLDVSLGYRLRRQRGLPGDTVRSSSARGSL